MFEALARRQARRPNGTAALQEISLLSWLVVVVVDDDYAGDYPVVLAILTTVSSGTAVSSGRPLPFLCARDLPDATSAVAYRGLSRAIHSPSSVEPSRFSSSMPVSDPNIRIYGDLWAFVSCCVEGRPPFCIAWFDSFTFRHLSLLTPFPFPPNIKYTLARPEPWLQTAANAEKKEKPVM